jgi:hypothetical protein
MHDITVVDTLVTSLTTFFGLGWILAYPRRSPGTAAELVELFPKSSIFFGHVCTNHVSFKNDE